MLLVAVVCIVVGAALIGFGFQPFFQRGKSQDMIDTHDDQV